MKQESIEEVIVVEGKDDTRRIQEVLSADTIETIGSAINEEIIERIIHAQETRGVIVFTDPDYSGEKIRKIIMAEVPDAKHAFLPRDKARGKKKYASLGVEHASDEAILAALEHLATPTKEKDIPKIPRQILLDYGLIGGQKAKRRRELLGDELRIGYTNGKQLEKRLTMFRVTEEDLVKAMKIVEENL
ncbi:MAG: ribonuclease M5 [Tetragenococcus halophilus]|nr:ribonuclease M5 [Tetragenococcus halophilus]